MLDQSTPASNSYFGKDLKILNDKELDQDGPDSINFKYLAKTIKRIALTSETPITIGIYGDWGSGKSSTMKIAKSYLDEGKGNKTIWFNAWKFDKLYDLRMALIETILKELELEPRLREMISDVSKKIDWISISKIAASIAVQSPFFGADLLRQKEIIYSIIEFNEKFNSIIKEYTKKGPLIIFIDDLDRCLPEKVIDILEAIKLFLDAEGCVFIIGVNKDIIEQSIKAKYKDAPINGFDYMEKIIQVSLNLPDLRQEDAERYVNDIAPAAIKKYKNIIARGGGNPRRIKRILNKFILQLIILEENEELEKAIDKEILAKLSVVELRWNKFYNYLLRSYNLELNESSLLKEFKDIVSERNGDDIKERIEKTFYKDIIREYYLNQSLSGFLSEKPSLWNVGLEPYVFLNSTIVQEDVTLKYGNKAILHTYIPGDQVYREEEEPDRSMVDRLGLGKGRLPDYESIV